MAVVRCAMSDYEVPSDDEVVQVLSELGLAVTAMQLCGALVNAGHQVRQSQLAIQRAATRGRIRINDDWTLTAVRESIAA